MPSWPACGAAGGSDNSDRRGGCAMATAERDMSIVPEKSSAALACMRHTDAYTVGRYKNPDKTRWVAAIASFTSNGPFSANGGPESGLRGFPQVGIRPAIDAVSQSPIIANYRFFFCELASAAASFNHQELQTKQIGSRIDMRFTDHVVCKTKGSTCQRNYSAEIPVRSGRL
jgi:hypothetical protein